MTFKKELFENFMVLVIILIITAIGASIGSDITRHYDKERAATLGCAQYIPEDDDYKWNDAR